MVMVAVMVAPNAASVRDTMGEKGCIDDILTLIQQHIYDEGCRETACWALKNLITDCGTCLDRCA